MGALSENPDCKTKTASPNLRFGAGNWGLAGLEKIALEKTVALGVFHHIINHQIIRMLKV